MLCKLQYKSSLQTPTLPANLENSLQAWFNYIWRFLSSLGPLACWGHGWVPKDQTLIYPFSPGCSCSFQLLIIINALKNILLQVCYDHLLSSLLRIDSWKWVHGGQRFLVYKIIAFAFSRQFLLPLRTLRSHIR